MYRDKIDRSEYPFDDTDLSPHMEDYLEAIALLADKNRVVRVKDIARALKVKMPSVTAALQKLSERGLINYQKYGFIDLTDSGHVLAEKVYSRHSCLTDFFHHVLRLDMHRADEEACRIEHHLSPASCRQLYKLVEYVKGKMTDGPWINEFSSLMEERPLSEMREGESGVIARIGAAGDLKKRLMEMGFRKGGRLSLVRYAPLQDPLQVKLGGFNILLRVEEARTIIVKPLEDGTDDETF